LSVEEATIDGPWIERLAHYLKAEEYSPSAIRKRMTAARGFLHYLGKQGIDVVGATAAHEEAFLIHKLDSRRRRDGHSRGF
jgi:hypothetical protein